MKTATLLKMLASLATALLLMLAFRATVFTLVEVQGQGLAPLFTAGDRLLVNRWSYGLRTRQKALFGYSRLCRRPLQRGDVVLFESPADGALLICRCRALPGDTVATGDTAVQVPGRRLCAERDYYWMEAVGPANATDSRTLGFISEELVVGRVCAVAYSRDASQPLWAGWRARRFFLPVP